MSLNRYVKIPAIQGGNYTVSNNILDFDLDMNKTYNLDNSWVEIVSNVSTTIPSGLTGDTDILSSTVGKVNSQIDGDSNITPKNIMLVKNCSLRSSNVGFLEDIRAVNTLKATMNLFQQNHTVEESENFKQMGSKVFRNNLKSLMFQELQKVGSVPSRNVPNCPIRIKLSELFSLGQMKEFSTNQQGLGRVRVHLELSPELLVVSPSTAAEQNTSPESPPAGDILLMADINDTTGTQVIRTRNDGTDKNIFNNLEVSPYHVGMSLKVQGTDSAGGADLEANRTVTAIAYNDDLTLSLTLNSDVVTLTGNSYSDVSVEILEDTSASIIYNFAELVVQEVSNPDPAPRQLSYTTYTTEQVSSDPNVESFQRLFQVEPQCINLFVMFPDTILSQAGGIDKYRIRCDNIDKTNRDVHIHSPLYYETMNNTFLSAGLTLRNLNGLQINQNQKPEGAEPDNDAENHMMICTPLYETPAVKNVQLNIESDTTTFDKMNLYKQVVRTIMM